jgi:predicted nucleic acid-binding protein
MMSVSADSTKVIADTNILLYAFDTSEPVKHSIANKLLNQLIREKRLALSVQNLNEFYNIVTKPNRAFSMAHEDAVQVLHGLATACEMLLLTPETTFQALDAKTKHGMSLWDALVWAVARQNSVSVIYTGDSQSAEVIDGIRYVNPFVKA